MARRTAGQRFESTPEDKPEQVQSAPDELVAAAEESASAEQFPSDVPSAIALLNQVLATPTNNRAEWELAQPRLKALRLHVNKLQQGLPVVPSKATDFNHQHMQSVMRELQLNQLQRTNPLIRDLIAERDELKKKLEAR